jgi:putative DNA primase/helicase
MFDFEGIATILSMAGDGFQFVGTTPGMTRSDWNEWQNKATNRGETLKHWIDEGCGLVSVAKHGHGFLIDIDDCFACVEKGFELNWLDGYFEVKTPGGGLHFYGLHDVVSEALGNLVVVHETKGDKKSPKVFELKLNNQSVAAPGTERKNQPKKNDGIYQPVGSYTGMKRGLPAELLAWLKENAEEPRVRSAEKAELDFHPEFDREDFLEHHQSTEDSSGMVNDTLHVVVDQCPICGKDARNSTVAAGITKFIFGGNSFGFICHTCGIDSREQLEEELTKLDPDFEPWEWCIYRHDDAELEEQDLLEAGVETIGPAKETEDTKEETAEAKSLTKGFTYCLNDTGNGERLVRKFGDSIRWVHETDEWMVWSTNGWRKDNGRKLMAMAKAIQRELANEAVNNTEDKTLWRHAEYTGSMAGKKNMVKSAGYEKGVFTNLSDWDSDGWLLNVMNGVIDLKTQTFRERTKADLCMKQSPVAHDPNAQYLLWEQALDKWLCDDKSLLAYLQVACGVTLTSDVSLQSLFFCQGGGENGKDTFFAAIRHVAGNYAKDVAFATFAETKNHSEHRNDLAVLAGAIRMVTASESTDGNSLDEGIIKAVTGGPESKVTCRHIHGKPFSYTPQFKPWFMSNHEPVIKGNDWGIWRRVKKIPWNYTLKPGEKDPEFAEKLKAEAAGILNWMLVGLRRYLELGKNLPPCKAVEEATSQYRKDMDVIGQFADQRLILDYDAKTAGQEIYKKYQEWCRANGRYSMQSNRFHAQLQRVLGGKVQTSMPKGSLAYQGLLIRGSEPEIETEDV